MNMFMLISLILYNWTSFPIMWSVLSALWHTFNQILMLVCSGSICLWFVMGLISIIDFLGNRMQSSNASKGLWQRRRPRWRMTVHGSSKSFNPYRTWHFTWCCKLCKWEEGGEDLFHTEYDSNELIHDLNFRISIAIGSPNHITHKKK